MRAFILFTRPIFLVGGILLYGLGVLIAFVEGSTLHPVTLIPGLLMVIFIQLTAQYANEYYDIECDRLNSANRTWFTGGSGVLPAGTISANIARHALQLSTMLAVFSIVIVAIQNPLTGVLGLIGLTGAWLYSAPPFSLMGSGWGELFASLIVALLVPAVGYILQAVGPSPLLLAVCSQLVLLHMAMLIGFELPDWEADQAVGKRTLRVRLGPQKILYLHAALLITAFLLLFILQHLGISAARWIWLALPAAVVQGVQVALSYRLQANRFRWITLGAVALFVLTTILWWIGFLLSGRES